jgi:small subunit ribosomal protein S4
MTKRETKLCKIKRQVGLNLWRTKKNLKSLKLKNGQHTKGYVTDFNDMKEISSKSLLDSRRYFRKYYININLKHYNKLEKNFGIDGIIFMESRLDSLLYRSGFSVSMLQSRLLISHGHINVNNLICTNPSCLIKSGDIISISKNLCKLINLNIKQSIQQYLVIPKYLELDYNNHSFILIYQPDIHNIPFEAFEIV